MRASDIQYKANKEAEMKEAKKVLMILLAAALVMQMSACAMLSSTNTEAEEPMNAEETLQAIYAQETQEAATVVEEDAESEPADAVPPDKSELPSRDGRKGQGEQNQQRDQPQGQRAQRQRPGEVPEPDQTLEDSDSSLRSDENRVLSGDNFLNNLYERPFTAYDMIYQPDLDIYTVDFAYDDYYFYFTITLNGKNVEEWLLTGMYGIEFDRTLTGRGDLLVLVHHPRDQWSLVNLIVFSDENADVGGPTPIVADEGFNGDGYDTKEILIGDEIAFARMSPDDDQAVQIAVSRALLGDPEEFLWGAWAGKDTIRPPMFDLNDVFGESEAGSPYSDSEDYPIKALFNLDNTCRLPYGFSRMSTGYAGMCVTSAPTPMPGDDDNPDCTCTDYCVDGVTCCGQWICD